ncbi:MAG: sulfatase/phosphatase domain-containing protein, partial [Verrucomicrobiota bacterium]
VVAAGKVSDAPVCSIDLFPTILDSAELAFPTDREIDGISLLAHLESASDQSLGRDELIWQFPHYRHPPGPYSIIRKGNFKLIKFWEGSSELYDLGDDLGEENDLSKSMPEKVRDLDVRLVDQLKAMNAKLPIPNPDWKG